MWSSATRATSPRLVRPDTALVIVETPANPTLELVDIASVVAQAGSVPVLVDNTFATPVLQNPLDLGARMSLHSATKYLGGHGDVVGGVIACDEETAAALRRVRAITGGLLHPLAAYLLHRGLTTLPIRVRTQQASARVVADRLREHPAVERVYYPRAEDDARGLLTRQMRGPGAMISIALRGGYLAAERLTCSLRLFTHAVSLGGVDSLVQHPAALTHRPVTEAARPADNVVRLSIGLEDPTTSSRTSTAGLCPPRGPHRSRRDQRGSWRVSSLVGAVPFGSLRSRVRRAASSRLPSSTRSLRELARRSRRDGAPDPSHPRARIARVRHMRRSFTRLGRRAVTYPAEFAGGSAGRLPTVVNLQPAGDRRHQRASVGPVPMGSVRSILPSEGILR